MENELLELKEVIKNLPVNRLGHRTYSDELRDRVVGAALAWRSEGKSLSQLAFAIGVQRSLVSSWVRKREMRGASGEVNGVARVRAITIADDMGIGTQALTIRFPNGAEVMGLSVQDLSQLMYGR